MSPTTSPCINVCSMDPDTKLCRGCFRTIEEIAAWPSLDDRARAALRRVLADRVRIGVSKAMKAEKLP